MAINIRFTAQEQEVIKALKAMGGETAKLVDENIKLANQFARTDAEAKFYARGIGRVKAEAEAAKLAQDKLTDSTNKLTAAQAKQANSRREAIANGIASAVGFQFGGPAAGIGGAIGGLQGAAIGGSIDGLVALGQEVSKTTEKYNRLQMALDTATGSAANGAKAFSFIVDIARQTGLRIDDLADSYKGFAAASRGTKLEGKETERIFTSIVKAGAAMMLSNEQVKGSLLAVSQMMSKGNVQAEELRGQLSERLPGAFNILASEMGVTTAQLNDLLKAGAVLSEDALPKLANGLDKISKDQYKKNLDTITGAMNNLKNEVDLAMVAFGRETEINSFFAAILNGAASVVRSGYLQKISEAMLGLPYQAYKNEKIRERMFEKITPAQAIGEASQLDLTTQKKRLDRDRLKIKEREAEINGLKELAPYEKEEISRLEKLQSVEIVNYSLRKKAYDGERIQRAEKKKADEEKLNLGKKEIAQLKDINKEIDKNRSLLNDLRKKDPTGFTESVAGKGLMKKIAALNEEKAKIEEFGKIGKPPKGGSKESEFEKQIREENEEGKDLFKARLEIIKQARLDAERLANTPTAFSSSPIDSVMPLFGGKKVADIQTGFGNELLQSSILNRKWENALLFDVPAMAQALTNRLSSFQEKVNQETGNLELQVAFDPESIKKAMPAAQISGIMTDLFGEINTEIYSMMADTIQSMGVMLGNSFATFGEAVATGENPFKAFGEMMLDSLSNILIQMGAQLLGAAALFAALAIPTMGITSANASSFAIAGAAMTTAGGVMKAVKFADGGIVSGRTFAEVGEYRGARNNPEVIAPLNKLGTIFTPFFQRAVSMGRVNQPKLAMQPVTTTTNVYMDGKVLLQQLDRTILRQGRI